MASAREIKKRIRSVKNIGQITRALEAVSASRVRKAQARVLASRAYAEKAWEILLNVQSTGQKGVPMHPLLTERQDVRKVMIVLVTSDRGLAGAFNTNIIRVAQRFAQRLGKPVEFVTVGRKGRDSLIRAREKVVAEFTLPAEPTAMDIAPISRLAIDEFLSGHVDDVFIAYTDFINTLTQRPVVQGWLPLIPHQMEDAIAGEYLKSVPAIGKTNLVYEYEPSPVAILDEIVPRFTELQLYQAVLESAASEHSARMVAMRNASDNAIQLAADYTLVYNKARQAAITNEILDIVGGAEALQSSIDKLAEQILLQHQYDMLETPRNGASEKKAGSEKKASTEKKSAPAPVAEAVAQAVAEPVMVVEAEAASASGKLDNLTKIEGIGPKMSAALVAAGIDTFEKLAEMGEASLRSAIEAAGMKFSPTLPSW
ncbi:MAG TPA: ATP synthase F1 subunit gamma, partial [Phototrophicaceae bacterium]|nr:ATP synthase F1 subunit gamma [Phototrophicaceae bacterium]